MNPRCARDEAEFAACRASKLSPLPPSPLPAPNGPWPTLPVTPGGPTKAGSRPSSRVVDRIFYSPIIDLIVEIFIPSTIFLGNHICELVLIFPC